MKLKVSPIVSSKLECLVDHYFNDTKLNSWKFDQMYDVLKNKVHTDTEEELIFKCLIYIYENLVSYAFKYDVSRCMILLKNTLESNKMSRLRYRRIRILESFMKGLVIEDRELINLILEQLEYLIDYILNRMLPEASKNQRSVPIGLKGNPWIKLARPIDIENPLISQIENYGG